MNVDSTAGLVVVLALAPFVLVALTSFVKIAAVLSILRNAMGAPEVPPALVVTGLAAILAVFVMAPVAQRVYQAAQPLPEHATLAELAPAAARAREPLADFLAHNAHARDRAMFTDLARRLADPPTRAEIGDRDLTVLAPAFVTSELKEAFSIGFLLLLPFLIIDLVVANVLAALGLHTLSPTTISLPFKLLLFVVVDGWALLARGLVLSYA